MYSQHRSVTLNSVSTSSSEQLHENAYIQGRAWTKRLSHNKVITDDRDQAVTVKSPDHGWFDSIAAAYAEQRPITRTLFFAGLLLRRRIKTFAGTPPAETAKPVWAWQISLQQ